MLSIDDVILEGCWEMQKRSILRLAFGNGNCIIPSQIIHLFCSLSAPPGYVFKGEGEKTVDGDDRTDYISQSCIFNNLA